MDHQNLRHLGRSSDIPVHKGQPFIKFHCGESERGKGGKGHEEF